MTATSFLRQAFHAEHVGIWHVDLAGTGSYCLADSPAPPEAFHDFAVRHPVVGELLRSRALVPFHRPEAGVPVTGARNTQPPGPPGAPGLTGETGRTGAVALAGAPGLTGEAELAGVPGLAGETTQAGAARRAGGSGQAAAGGYYLAIPLGIGDSHARLVAIARPLPGFSPEELLLARNLQPILAGVWAPKASAAAGNASDPAALGAGGPAMAPGILAPGQAACRPPWRLRPTAPFLARRRG